MREILFRGKRLDNGEWVCGDLIHGTRFEDQVYIRFNSTKTFGYHEFEVDCETVGQYTGLTDKNGTKIFEGDIVHYDLHGEYCSPEYYRHKVGPVIFSDQCFMPLTFCVLDTLVVSGNIHDNPELMPAKTN